MKQSNLIPHAGSREVRYSVITDQNEVKAAKQRMTISETVTKPICSMGRNLRNNIVIHL